MNEELIRSKKDFWFACVDIEVIRDKTLSPTTKCVFAVLCSFVNINNRACWPSNETVAETAGVSVATVKRAYNELSERGIIKRSIRKTPENGQITSYTVIVGHNAECYQDTAEGSSPMNHPQLTDELPPSSPMSHEINKENNIYYSNEGSGVPVAENLNSQAEAKKPEQSRVCQEEAHGLSEVPEIMRSTAELLLFKTGRKALTEGEISALKELARNQVPARVQKEIATAVERFKRQDRDLKTLHFEYIANALAHQPTRGKAGTKQAREKIRKETQEFDAMQNADNTVSDEEFEALMAEIHGGRLS